MRRGITGIVYRNRQYDFYAIYFIHAHLFDTFRELTINNIALYNIFPYMILCVSI